MTPTTLQEYIDFVFGTFDDDSHEVYLVNKEELARDMVMLTSTPVHSFETGGGLMFDWVVGVWEDEDEL